MQDSDALTASKYRFGDCCIDKKRREITRADGQITVEPKAFELLLYLIENRDRAVDKQELQDKIWAGTIVTDAALTRCVTKARRAVGDDPQKQEVIKTIQRHGYRFVAPLLKEDESGLDRRAAVSKLRLSRASTDTPAIAVLPFVDLSAEQDQQYFCDGMAEELINSLSRIDGVQVVGRSSSFQFRGIDPDIWTIGEKLDVTSLLEGSVQKLGDQLRMRLQLVDIQTGYQIWSQKYARKLEDVFAIQDDIAEHVAKSIMPPLTSTERKAIQTDSTREFKAYDFYLRGLQYFHRFTSRGYLHAIEMFRKSLEVDPTYIPARAGLANSHAFLYQWFHTDPEHLRAAEEASAKAVEMDPSSAEAHTAWGNAESLRRHHSVAEESFEKAIALNPNLYEAHYFYARVCAAQGKHARAVELFERAANLRHDEFQCRYLAAQSYKALGLTGHMKEWAQKTIDVVEPLLALNPDNVRALYLGAAAWAMLGNESKGREYTNQSLKLQPEDPVTVFSAACQFAQHGDNERALTLLENMSIGGFLSRDWVEHDPTLDTLRDEPRFKAVLERFS